jgi:hypothetical protein
VCLYVWADVCVTVVRLMLPSNCYRLTGQASGEITPQFLCRRALEASRASAIVLPLHFHWVLCRTCRTCVELVVELVVFYQGVVELVHFRKISFCNIYII